MNRSLRIRDTDRFEPDWVKTDAERRRWRQHFTVGLLGYCGCSSRFIADAVSLSDGRVRTILRSEITTHINFSAILAATR
ncbi:MAG: hypothetical protein P4L84_37240 [Isosphaeraceae bacterium]|nr:hypothetical protein [Isosphaeraceae bacterium]